MKQLFNYLLIWGILIASFSFIAQLFMRIEDKHVALPETIDTPVIAREREVPAALMEDYRRAGQAYKEKNYLLALKILHQIESGITTDKQLPAKFRHKVYHLKGAAHWALWQYIDAEHAWVAALEHAVTNEQKNRLTGLLGEVQRVLEAVNDERSQRQVYLASPNAGPASSLKGKIVLMYIFIKDKNSDSWSLRDRTHTINSWGQVEKWLSDKAGNYGSQVSFVKRWFVVDRHPDVNRLRVGDVSQQFKNADQVVKLVASHFGHKDILSFIKEVTDEEQAKQAILIFHLGKSGRSFASRCMGYCGKGNGEFVFLMESTRSKHWQSLEYAQAHESLHLFGADDLYNIRAARNYAVKDIMNYPSSILWGSSMEDITAYAIGLKKMQPRTPFAVKTYTN